MSKITARYFSNTCVVDSPGRRKNFESVLARGLEVCGQLPEREGALAVVGSGPSVRGLLWELADWPGEVWAINGAYDYLQDKGIVPDGFFGIDPLPGLAAYLRRPNEKTTFYIASMCDPAVFDALAGYQVKLWHAAGEDTFPKGHWIVGGGTTAITRAPYFALLRGWRDITLYGADSSFADDGSEYCYKWGSYEHDIAQPKHKIMVNGEGPFVSEVGLLKQASQLYSLHERFRGMLKFRCEGLLDAYMRAPVCDDSNLEIEEDEAA